jgi:hypothetical protein
MGRECSENGQKTFAYRTMVRKPDGIPTSSREDNIKIVVREI